MENENKMYGYYISFEYAREVFNFDFFGTPIKLSLRKRD